MSVEKRFRRCVDPCPALSDTHDLCVMCLGEEQRASVLGEWSAFIVRPFSVGKSSLLGVPFSRENWGDHLPPAARVQPLLRQWRDWVRGDRRWSLRMSLRERKKGIFHLALDSGWREWTAGGRCIVCYIFWSSRMCFAGSWCASRDVELLEVIKHALLLGKPTVDARKGGVARSRLDERSLSGITPSSREPPIPSPDIHSKIVNHIQPASIGKAC